MGGLEHPYRKFVLLCLMTNIYCLAKGDFDKVENRLREVSNDSGFSTEAFHGGKTRLPAL